MDKKTRGQIRFRCGHEPLRLDKEVLLIWICRTVYGYVSATSPDSIRMPADNLDTKLEQ